MYKIEKEKLGKFISELRREKGYKQKDLAQKLYVSDKAVSKWETGASIPDTALLIPLAEILGVSVTELLLCERIKENETLQTDDVESIVKTAISYSEDTKTRACGTRSIWQIIYIISVIVGVASTIIISINGSVSEAVLTLLLFGIVIGAYFCFFTKIKLPTYYDENRIGVFHDGPVRMNLPGVVFNNSNWKYVVLTIRIWSCGSTAAFPLIAAVMTAFLPSVWQMIEIYVFAAILLCGLPVPVYTVAKKYE